MNGTWHPIKLGQALHKSDDWITLEPDREYKEVTVRLWGKGVVLRGMSRGAEIAAGRRLAVREGQLILSRIDARNGALGVVPASLAGAIVSNDFPAFNVERSLALPEFLGWFIKTGQFVELCKRASEGTTNRVRLQEEKFLMMEVPLPPLDEQRRVVSRIEELAAKVEETRRLRREAIEETNAVLMSGWRRAFAASGADSWRRLSVEECCEAMIDYRGRTPPVTDAGIPHLTSRNIKGGRIDWNTDRFVTEDTYEKYMTRGIPEPGDVIFTMEAPLGEAAVVPDDRRFSLAQRTLLLRAKQGTVDGEFLSKALMSPQVRESIYAKAMGTTVKGIASKRLKHIPLPIPPIAEQRRIVDYLGDLQAKVDSLKKLQSETAAELDALMPSILSKAFGGEL